MMAIARFGQSIDAPKPAMEKRPHFKREALV
jgi:hypothetical protein